jgi:hypothetical protein
MIIDSLLNSEYRYDLYLCKPFSGYEIIGCLSDCVNITNINKQLSNVNELSFSINKYWNDIDNSSNEYFDLINTGQLILLEEYIDDTLNFQEYFYIYEIEVSGGEKELKTIKSYSKHYQLNKIKVKNFQDTDNFVATRQIYNGLTFDASDSTKGGILDYVIQEKLYNTWTVSYISSNISSVYRTFDISEQSLLDVFKTIETLFNCIFFFDNINNDIQIKHIDDLDGETGIIISGENYIKDITEQIKIDEIVTRLYVDGKDIDISGVNITGQPYLDDFSFFKNTNYMSQDLIDALNDYDTLKSGYAGTYSGYLSSLSVKQSELSQLQIELSNLETAKISAEDNEDSCIKFGTGTGASLTWNGHNWAYWHNAYLSASSAVTSKQNQITVKNSEISAINSNIYNLGGLLSYESNFTTQQLQELLQFINEDTVKCETDNEEELLLYGQEILELRSSPPIEFTVNIIDIFNYSSESYAWDKLTLGSKVDVEFESLNIQSKPRITAINHNPNSSSLSITVSNKPYFNDDLSYISSLIAISRKTSTVLNNEKSIYKEYSNDKSDILFSGNELSASSNPLVTDNSVEISRRGMWMKKIRESSNAELRILEDKILISKDNWSTFNTAITSDGIYCNSLWVLTNTDGSVEINDNTINISDMNLELTANNGRNTIIINPEDGIKIKKGNDTKLDFDDEGNMNIDGYISIGSGNNIFKADTNGIYLGNGTFASAPFRVAPNGAVVASNITITGGSINVSSNATVGNNISVGESLIFRSTSVTGGIRWGTDFGSTQIYSDPSSGSLYLYALNNAPIYANGNRIDAATATFG